MMNGVSGSGCEDSIISLVSFKFFIGFYMYICTVYLLLYCMSAGLSFLSCISAFLSLHVCVYFMYRI